jgi:hypothetical protein
MSEIEGKTDRQNSYRDVMVGNRKFRDIEVGQRQYRIGLLTALIGSAMAIKISQGRADANVQAAMLALVSILEPDGTPMLLFADGKWTKKGLDLGLEYDLITVTALYSEALDFNFDPFFEEEKRIQSLRASRPIST